MAVIIPRNTSFPSMKKYHFTTTSDNQTEFTVKIFEGDSDKTKDNEYLGHFTLEDLPHGNKAGQLKIDVTFDIDGNRNLTVTASEYTSGRSVRAKITADWLSKVNYHDLPGEYKSSDQGKFITQEYLSLRKFSSAAYW